MQSQKEKKEVNNSGLLLEYSVPITNGAEIDGDFTIQGVAINETTTSNGHKFIGEELQKSAQTLVGVPLLKDHNNSVDAIVGRVMAAHFNEDSRNIPFKAVIKDPVMKQKIKDKLINSVSVGAHVDPKDIEETENGDIIPHGITFKELSLVAVPADPAATFGVALNNAYKLHSNENINTTERGSMNMTKLKEEEEKTETPVTEEPKSEPEVQTEEPKEEEAAVEEKIKAVELKLKKKKLAMLEKQLAESDADEEKEEEKEEEEEETEEKVEEKSKYNIVQNGGAFTYERKSYVYN